MRQVWLLLGIFFMTLGSVFSEVNEKVIQFDQEFAQSDFNKNGTIGYREFLIAQGKKYPQTRQDKESLTEQFYDFDKNNNQRVTLEEFLQGMLLVLDTASNKEEVQVEATEIFEILDYDGNKDLMLKEFLVNIPFHVLNNLKSKFQQIDLNNDGELSKYELVMTKPRNHPVRKHFELIKSNQ